MHASRAKGWGARLLELQGDDGNWEGGAYFPGPAYRDGGDSWMPTAWSAEQLREFGVAPDDERVKAAIELVRDHSKWEHEGQDFFAGEVEPCINGLALGIGSYFGQDVRGIADRLLTEQMEDGGWNCEQENGSVRGSFDTTIDVLEGLLAYERATGDRRVKPIRERGEEFLLERGLFRRKSTGEVANEDYLRFSYPTRYIYDILRALDYLRSTGAAPDPRVAEAVELVRSKQRADGRWALENTHPGRVHFELDEGDGKPSRWNTLRAMRVLEWAEQADG